MRSINERFVTFLLLWVYHAQAFCTLARFRKSGFRFRTRVCQQENEAIQDGDDDDVSASRRNWLKVASFAPINAMGLGMTSRPAYADSKRSRVSGYEVQKSEQQWQSELSSRQFDVLRNGGTERPYSSVLEEEERTGTYSCVGCGTPLFTSAAKFHSGTGWPSFATALAGVEVEKVGFVQAQLAGAELRCKTCGGHLGDIFSDGFLFVGTPAAESGKRLCIDGSALVFESSSGEKIVGDLPPTKPPRPFGG